MGKAKKVTVLRIQHATATVSAGVLQLVLQLVLRGCYMLQTWGPSFVPPLNIRDAPCIFDAVFIYSTTILPNIDLSREKI